MKSKQLFKGGVVTVGLVVSALTFNTVVFPNVLAVSPNTKPVLEVTSNDIPKAEPFNVTTNSPEGLPLYPKLIADEDNSTADKQSPKTAKNTENVDKPKLEADYTEDQTPAKVKIIENQLQPKLIADVTTDSDLAVNNLFITEEQAVDIVEKNIGKLYNKDFSAEKRTATLTNSNSPADPDRWRITFGDLSVTQPHLVATQDSKTGKIKSEMATEAVIYAEVNAVTGEFIGACETNTPSEVDIASNR